MSPPPLPADRVLHHVSIGATRIDASALFYDAVLAPLGLVRVWADLRPGQTGQAVGYGPPGAGDLVAIKQVEQGIPVLLVERGLPSPAKA